MQAEKLGNLATLLAAEAYVNQLHVKPFLQRSGQTVWEWFADKQARHTAGSALEEATRLMQSRRGTYTGETRVMLDKQVLRQEVVDPALRAAAATDTTAEQVIADLAGFDKALRSRVAEISARPVIAFARATLTPAQDKTYTMFATTLLCWLMELRLEAATHGETVDAALARRRDTLESWLVATAHTGFDDVAMYIQIMQLPAASRTLYRASLNVFDDFVAELSIRAALAAAPITAEELLTQARRVELKRVAPYMAKLLRPLLPTITGARREKLAAFLTTMLRNLATLWLVADTAGVDDAEVLRRAHKSLTEYVLAPSDVRFDVDLDVFSRPLSASRQDAFSKTVWACVRAVERNETPAQFLANTELFEAKPDEPDIDFGARRRCLSRSRPRFRPRSRSRSRPRSRRRRVLRALRRR